MKAIDFLKLIIKQYPDFKAIAADNDGRVYIFKNEIPEKDFEYKVWDVETNSNNIWEFYFPLILEWDSNYWAERIITINDL